MLKICYKRNQNASSCRLGREVALLHKTDGVYYRLNEIGGVLWDELKAPRSTEELAGIICEKFDTNLECARQDVQAFIDELKKIDLVQGENS